MLAAQEDWKMHSMDFVSVFLNDVLDIDIYMEQLEGFVAVGQKDRVCKLKKAIYGLKQTARVWNNTVHIVLQELGFTCTFSGAGAYVYHQGGVLLFIILYVDNITLFGNQIQ
ncbi:hypothetical protein AX16_002450 [Volvariella volvacea WC 439]|nr:hypothetical protein AX16_002450 [Volvariella volvacea WC 439]